MTYLARFSVLVFLSILCFKISSPYPDTVNAQGSDTTEDSTSMPHAEVISQLLNFTEESVGDCSHPCFAGIRPDETTLSEIQELSIDLFNGDDTILAQFDKPFERQDGQLIYTLRSEVVEGYFDLSFMISPHDEILRRFKASLFYPESWLEARTLDINVTLKVLGPPDEIYVSIAASQPPQFSIVLGYRDLGMVFLYTYSFDSEQLTQSDEPIPLCGSWANTYYVYVWIQAVDEEFYEDLLEENLRLRARESTGAIVYRAFWPLERMTNLNIEEFTQSLAENPAWCFDALSYEELLESGYSY